MKKIGIITFHRSYNCGSMLQAFALQTVIQSFGLETEIINFSNEGQRRLYRLWFPVRSARNIVKNILLLPHQRRINHCNESYKTFMLKNMCLSDREYFKSDELTEQLYSKVIAGSDQIWNITIDDSDDAYFLPWINNAKKIAYAPSFGAKNILQYAENPSKYADYLSRFDALSIRENNGRDWIKDLIGKDVPVVLDPTLLLDAESYMPLVQEVKQIPKRYIFYYAPHYDTQCNQLVKAISTKLWLPVIAFNSKAFYVKRLDRYGFTLPENENPSVYLALIKNAELIITTSFHGTIFSSIFRKKFWTILNGGMLYSDDRVVTMTGMLDLNDRLIPITYDDAFDYSAEKDYSRYENYLKNYRVESLKYLSEALEADARYEN